MFIEQKKESTIVNGETAIKPYYYMRNGLLHVRYTVDRCVELSESEEKRIKEELAEEPFNKQAIFSRQWNFLTQYVGKAVHHDGIALCSERIKASKGKADGYQG